VKKYGALRTSFMALSSTTSHVGIMRLLMNSQKSRLVGLRFHRTFSREISTNHPSTLGRTEGSTGVLLSVSIGLDP
jgi:hypothetical protein